MRVILIFPLFLFSFFSCAHSYSHWQKIQDRKNIQNLLQTAESGQEKFKGHFQEFLKTENNNNFNNFNNNYASELEDTFAALKTHYDQIHQVHKKGEFFFDKLEKEAQSKGNIQEQSDQLRKITKLKRKFRLFYLSLRDWEKSANKFYRILSSSPNDLNILLLNKNLNTLKEKMAASQLMGKKFRQQLGGLL